MPHIILPRADLLEQKRVRVTSRVTRGRCQRWCTLNDARACATDAETHPAAGARTAEGGRFKGLGLVSLDWILVFEYAPPAAPKSARMTPSDRACGAPPTISARRVHCN
eukprot:scaffold655_cov379-Prasinococcus_capsulatus_cf.AAC.17